MKYKILGSLFLGLPLISGLACADSVTGTYGLTGYATVYSNAVDFGINSVSPFSQTANVTAATGSFTVPATSPIANTYNLTVVPGSTFAPTLFIADTADGIDVDITSEPIPSYGVCTGAGDTTSCRPDAASAVVLSQFTVAGMTQTIATLQASGEAFYTITPSTLSPVQIGLSATFTPGQSIDQILASFATNGFVATDYSDKLVVSAVTTTPEPGSLAVLGLGLVSLGVWKKRKAAK